MVASRSFELVVATMSRCLNTVHNVRFCDDEALIGGYEHSSTWFEANVSRPPGRDRILPRMIQTNRVASWKFHEHTNQWNFSDADPTLREFVTSIRDGDVIQVIPRARWPGWRNYIRGIQIEVYCKMLLSSISSKHVTSPADVPKRDTVALSPNDSVLYHPLNRERKDIRLLSLQSGEPDDPISCCLVTSALYASEIPTFEALSYCWGSPAKKKQINISTGNLSVSGIEITSQDQNLSITVNLDEALRRLRRKDGTSRLLWVDAICINQDDIPERGSQVGIMNEIYTKASSVVVWLGVSDATSNEAVHLLKTVFKRYERSDTAIKGHLPYADELGDDTRWNEVEYPNLLRVLTRFFNYPWFRRAWVVQELWLSRSAIICCGDATVPWECVMRANYWMNDSEGGGFYNIVQEPLPELWSTIAEHQNITSTVNDSKHFNETTNARMKILDLVLGGLVLNTTDPRDKVFALLGLGEETYSQDKLPSLLRPDYSKSTSQVYSDFTWWWIDKYKSLAILSAVHANAGRTWQGLRCHTDLQAEPLSSDHPSWALSHSGDKKWATKTLGLSSLFRASGDTTATLDLCNASIPFQLVLAGERIGTISTIDYYPYYQQQDDDLHRTYLRLFDPAGAFGTWSNAASIPKGIQEDCKSQKYQQFLLEHFITHWNRLPVRKASKEDFQIQKDEGTYHAEDMGFPCLDKCYFKIEDGSVGLCPTGAQEGDIVVLLYGGSVPYILRAIVEDPIKSSAQVSYKFVGECYVQGRMDGSGVKAQKGTKLTADRFTLV
ncbi:MAG: hypothetical protein Q9190_005676 [Brigantiaea leucoxantha]